MQTQRNTELVVVVVVVVVVCVCVCVRACVRARVCVSTGVSARLCMCTRPGAVLHCWFQGMDTIEGVDSPRTDELGHGTHVAGRNKISSEKRMRSTHCLNKASQNTLVRKPTLIDNIETLGNVFECDPPYTPV